jgi:hypothetical protein
VTASSGVAAAPPAWHDDAQRLGPALDRAAAVLVVGRDGEAVAWAALGAARAQATRRRVAVADLVGDAAPLAALCDPEDATGVSDSFFYGVSLNRIARPVDDGGTLFVLPSGSEPVAVAEVLTSDRWRRLAAGFRDAGALLILAARADAPGLDVLAAAVDGLVVVGDLGGVLPDAPPPLMLIPGPSARRGRRVADSRPAAAPHSDDAAAWAARQTAGGAISIPAGGTAIAPDGHDQITVDATGVLRTSDVAAGAPTESEGPPAPSQAAGPLAARRTRGVIPMLAGGAVLLAIGLWAWNRRPTTPVSPDRPTASAGGAAATAPTPAPAPGGPPAAAPAGAAPAGPLTVANPADSGSAAAYAVFLVSANTADGAALDGVDPATLPILSLTPVLDGGAPWWRLLAGAYPTRARADSLLADLQRRGVLGSSSGLVVRAPYALLVADRLPAAAAPARVAALSRQGVPTYPLSRGNGTVALYAGAFERPADAEYLANALRAAGVAPVLVYRTGGSL